MNEYIIYLLSYLSGSIPFGLLLTKLVAKTDIREHGSGNIGATNAVRVLGKKWGAVVLLLDGLKAMIPVLLVKHYYPNEQFLAVMTGIMAILGHIFPVWLGFKGGKGVSSLIFTLLAIDYKLGLIFIISWVLAYKLTKISAMGALSAVAIINIYVSFKFPMDVVVAIFVLSLIIFYKHKENIRRIIKGEELVFKK